MQTLVIAPQFQHSSRHASAPDKSFNANYHSPLITAPSTDCVRIKTRTKQSREKVFRKKETNNTEKI